MKIQPLHNNVLVKINTEDTKTPAGLTIPEGAKGDYQDGVVQAVGPGAIDRDGRFRETTVKPGNVVMFERMRRSSGLAGSIALPGEMVGNLLMISERDIVAVLVAG